MTPPRLIATDLDGTLLRSDSTLSPRTIDALRLARDAGVRVVAATARPARVVATLFPDTALIDAAICGNGAVQYDLHTGAIDVTKPMPLELSSWLMKEIIRWVPGAGFAVETGHFALYESGYRYRPTLDLDRVEVAGVADLMVDSLVKVMVWLPDGDPAGTWARLSPRLGHAVECTWSAPDVPLEISLRGVSKADALADLCARRQVTAAEVLAFGDGVNDVPMLAWAGLPYAVANADPAVLAVVANHCASNDADGVAQVLEALFTGSVLA